jgi:signal transduction histidine kinase
MWPANYFKSRAARLSLFYSTMLALSLAVLGGLTIYLTNITLYRQIDQKISAEMQRVASLQLILGTQALITDLSTIEIAENALSYTLSDQRGHMLFGTPNFISVPLGWSDIETNTISTQEQPDRFRVFAKTLHNSTIWIASDTDEIENISDILAGVFALTGIAALILAITGGAWLSRFDQKNLNRLAETAEAITLGDLDQRMPILDAGSGFDRLSSTLNLMLDRNAELLHLQRSITNDIAHDIRTPLTRLRQNLERLGDQEALQETDRLLEILHALLRIAELEEGKRLAKFSRIDLVQLAGQVVEAYTATFEERLGHFTYYGLSPVFLNGDASLLLQMLSNLVENILAHTPSGTNAVLRVTRTSSAIVMTMTDNGLGVIESDIPFLFQRFFRSKVSHAYVGIGLGLAMVRAIAKLHLADVSAVNLKPGLQIAVTWQIKNPE